jgi:hypothetical protein
MFELQKLATLLDTKGNKILQIFMLFTCKWVMVEYKTLIVKMWEDHIENETLQGPMSKSYWM